LTGVEWDVGEALATAGLLWCGVREALATARRRRRNRRIYDWQIDGECDNHSRIRLMP